METFRIKIAEHKNKSNVIAYQNKGKNYTYKLDNFKHIKTATSIEEIGAMEPSACEDLKAFERRLIEVVSSYKPSTFRWRRKYFEIAPCNVNFEHSNLLTQLLELQLFYLHYLSARQLVLGIGSEIHAQPLCH